MASGFVAASALVCAMISMRLMAAVEKAQVVVAGTIGRGIRSDKLVAMAIGTKKLFVLRLGIAFFSRISDLMFSIEGMYQERAVQRVASAMMNTVVTSTRVRVAVHHTRHAVKHVRQRLPSRGSSLRGGSSSPSGALQLR